MVVSQVALHAEREGMITAGWAWIGTSGVEDAESTVPIERNRAKRALFGWLFMLPFHKETAATTQFYDDVKTRSERDFDLSVTSSVSVYAANLWN